MAHEKKPQIIAWNLLSTNVCVPKDYTDIEAIEVSLGGLVKEIAMMKEKGVWETLHPETRQLLESHTDPKLYRIAKSEEMKGDPERCPCETHEGMVHMCVVQKDDVIRRFFDAAG